MSNNDIIILEDTTTETQLNEVGQPKMKQKKVYPKKDPSEYKKRGRKETLSEDEKKNYNKNYYEKNKDKMIKQVLDKYTVRSHTDKILYLKNKFEEIKKISELFGNKLYYISDKNNVYCFDDEIDELSQIENNDGEYKKNIIEL